MSDDYLWDKSGEPDPEIARLEEALAPLRHEGEWREPRAAGGRLLRFRRPAIVAGGVLALAAAVALAIGTWQSGPGSTDRTAGASSASSPVPSGELAAQSPCSGARPGFAFEATGPVTCDGAPAAAGSLPAGAWLETAEGATAALRVAEIGALTLHGGSRLRIVNTGPDEHRLELVKGSLHAKVKAPPRLFVVDTRAATAVDLGCEYRLSIDGRGRTNLHVIDGAVSLEGKGRAAIVPRGASVVADPERGPGTVLGANANESLLAAAGRLDRGDASALADVLRSVERTDSVTLFNLLIGTTRETRAAVVARLDALSLRPAKVSRDALIADEHEALQALATHLEEQWYRDAPGEAPKKLPRQRAPEEKAPGETVPEPRAPGDGHW